VCYKCELLYKRLFQKEIVPVLKDNLGEKLGEEVPGDIIGLDVT